MVPCENSIIAGIHYVMKKNRSISIVSRGFSMYPIIQEGDTCKFISLESNHTFSNKDILLYVSKEGTLVGHRYQKSYIIKGRRYFVLKGDTNALPDAPILQDMLIGRLTAINKKRFSLDPRGLIARFWGVLIIAFPFIPRYCLSIFHRK